jgi:hypothetical protein
MGSLYLERDGQNIIAVIKENENGISEHHEHVDLTNSQSYCFENEEKPVIVETWTSGGSHMPTKYVYIYEVIGNKVTLHYGEFSYIIGNIPFDEPIMLNIKNI